jgi:ketosteroid isomerase-like protein
MPLPFVAPPVRPASLLVLVTLVAAATTVTGVTPASAPAQGATLPGAAAQGATQPSAAFPGPTPPSDGDAAQAVRALDERRLAWLVQGDIDAMAGLLADELVYTHSNGRVDDKASYLAPLRAGTTRYLQYTPSEVSVRLLGDVAILTGRATMRAMVGGEERRNELRFTNVWLRRDGRWQMVAWHSLRLP